MEPLITGHTCKRFFFKEIEFNLKATKFYVKFNGNQFTTEKGGGVNDDAANLSEDI